MKACHLLIIVSLCIPLAMTARVEEYLKNKEWIPVTYTFKNHTSKNFYINFNYGPAQTGDFWREQSPISAAFVPANGESKVIMSSKANISGYNKPDRFLYDNYAEDLLSFVLSQTRISEDEREDYSGNPDAFYSGFPSYYKGPFPASTTTFIISENPKSNGKYIFEKQ